MSKVVVIGGGAAGMFAALGAADAGHQGKRQMQYYQCL